MFDLILSVFSLKIIAFIPVQCLNPPRLPLQLHYWLKPDIYGSRNCMDNHWNTVSNASSPLMTEADQACHTSEARSPPSGRS